MVVVNCDQDHRPDIKPGSVMKAKTESDTPASPATATMTMSTAQDPPDENTNANSVTSAVVDAAASEVWYLKPITFAGRPARVITQNFNG